jgi:hypothetical protein
VNLVTPKCKYHQNIKFIYENFRLDKTLKSLSKLGRGIQLLASAKRYRISDLTKTVGFKNVNIKHKAEK